MEQLLRSQGAAPYAILNSKNKDVCEGLGMLSNRNSLRHNENFNYETFKMMVLKDTF